MSIKILSYIVIFVLSVNPALVRGYFLSWGSSSGANVADAATDAVQTAAHGVESAAKHAADGAEDAVEEAERIFDRTVDEVAEVASDTESGLGSLFGRVRSRLRDLGGRLRDALDLDDVDATAYVNELLRLAPQQLSVVQQMLAGWGDRVRQYADDEWRLRRTYLAAARDDLRHAMDALRDSQYQAASAHFESALLNLRDESAIYRALQYALHQDTAMLPLVSDLSYSILNQLEYDLSDEK